jgi:thiamine-monophosphate kinase
MGILVALRYSADLSDADHASIASGIAQACARFRLPLLGGDSGSSDTCVLSASAFGVCPSSSARLRSQGKAGDILYLTGTVGLAAAAMAYFKRDWSHFTPLPKATEDALLRPWRRVEPPLAQGEFLVSERLSRCAIDTSDGLAVSCHHLAQASRVDVVLSRSAIPVDAELKAVAELLGIDLLSLALSESVDFRLLFSVNPQFAERVVAGFKAQGWPLYRVGQLELPSTSAEATVWLSQEASRTRVAQGYESRFPNS